MSTAPPSAGLARPRRKGREVVLPTIAVRVGRGAVCDIAHIITTKKSVLRALPLHTHSFFKYLCIAEDLVVLIVLVVPPVEGLRYGGLTALSPLCLRCGCYVCAVVGSSVWFRACSVPALVRFCAVPYAAAPYAAPSAGLRAGLMDWISDSRNPPKPHAVRKHGPVPGG